jgi:hypothetical protein
VAPARKLWLVGRSQVAECDPVFDYLKEMKLLDAVDYRARYALAIEDGSFGLARWLGRSIDSSHEANAQGWLTPSQTRRSILPPIRQRARTRRSGPAWPLQPSSLHISTRTGRTNSGAKQLHGIRSTTSHENR